MFIVVGNLLIAVCTILTVKGMFYIVRFFKFEIPFTNKMIQKGVLKESSKLPIIMPGLLNCTIIFIVGNGLCILGGFIIGASGFLTYGTIALITTPFMLQQRDRYRPSTHTVNQYIKAHSYKMDMQKIKSY